MAIDGLDRVLFKTRRAKALSSQRPGTRSRHPRQRGEAREHPLARPGKTSKVPLAALDPVWYGQHADKINTTWISKQKDLSIELTDLDDPRLHQMPVDDSGVDDPRGHQMPVDDSGVDNNDVGAEGEAGESGDAGEYNKDDGEEYDEYEDYDDDLYVNNDLYVGNDPPGDVECGQTVD